MSNPVDIVRADGTDYTMLADMVERVGLNEVLHLLSQIADDYKYEDLRRVAE